ncbi:MAG: hypothetical protein COY66_00115 [Candidatus Kerfeldbacteria bacterium CG_4_10_14_0_8_um_filter_42_10]|uniref:PilN domain-containing protein n=1 Tax=Candidatus Kerfeldbacteria bacterium CG_4_10_14_0_8_um_filter_42_10 TaxID=2014248 RepID=A0A2M7RKL6_9BACT|nr:MAG: hypothetical protein COY66_00115 [Candidatus Kerfeldbacteria bacterium CG_4_10_14_0_8_um_filter_42_10]
MITLNLISPIQKEANRFQQSYSLVKRITVLFMAVSLIVIALLFVGETLLEKKLDSITQETLALKKNIEKEESIDLEQSVKDFNKLLIDISKVQSEYINWSQEVNKISSLVPSGIRLSSFVMQKDSSDFKFAGKAATREALLNFKTNLENSDFFTEIQSPISNLLTKENINFELSGKLVFDQSNSGNQ